MTRAEADARVPATIEAADAAARTWDVLVVGAGPAGSFAAREAARAGLATLLVDRAAFPRAKACGGCLNHTAVEALRRAGLGDRLARLGGPTITAVRLRQDGRQASIAVPPGVAVSRRALDAMLVAAAIEAGAQFLPETSAAVARGGTAGHRLVELRPHAGTALEAEARVVVAADGLGQTSLRACGEFESRVRRDSRIGVGSLGPEGILALPPGTITMTIGRAGYVGAVTVEQGRVHVAGALDPQFVRQRGSPGRAVASVLEQAGVRGTSGLDALDWLGTPPLTRHTPHPAGRRVLLVGDAAGYVEPFTGEGMAWALALAGASTSFIRRGLRAWDPALEREWGLTCRSRIGSRQRTCRILTRALRRPGVVRAGIVALGHWPWLAGPLVARLGAGPGAVTGGAQ